MEDFFSHICAFGVDYENAIGHCRGDFNTQGAPVINEVNFTKETGMFFKCCEPYFQSRCTKGKGHQINHNNGQFPTGTVSFQASQQIKPGNDISLSSTMKHFLSRIGEKYTLQNFKHLIRCS